RLDLAREVHEGVIQRLFGVSMVLDGEGNLPAEMRARCASETQAALSELRDAMQRPLGRRSRDTSIPFGEELQRQLALYPALRIETGGVGQVPEPLEPLAQSVLGEALRNVSKHAAASAVSVRTELSHGAFVMEVVNDGVTDTRRMHPGMGLRLAAFEALQSGGIVEFGPRENGTWQVRLVVPYGD
ncbi:MAG TPA: hypothetical protein VME01_10570, partial [Solirubrobacteraceae bacterium]|nr:hypothetical protein [Solirubrobacteraceae bacterium]